MEMGLICTIEGSAKLNTNETATHIIFAAPPFPKHLRIVN